MKLTDEQKIFLAWLNKTSKIRYYEMVVGKDFNGDKSSPLHGVDHVAFRIFIDPSSYLHCVFSNEEDTMYVTEYHCTTKRIPSTQVGFINRYFSKYRLNSGLVKGVFNNSKQIYINYEDFMKIVDRIYDGDFYSRGSMDKDSYHRAGGLY
jgi:hypothetical protein